MQSDFRGGSDAFVVELSQNGLSPIYSTYFGGKSIYWEYWGYDQGGGIAVDKNGSAYLTGTTGDNLPTANAYDDDNSGSADAFVAKIGPGLSLESSIRDKDQDGIPDYADGFNLVPDDPDDDTNEEDVHVKCKIWINKIATVKRPTSEMRSHHGRNKADPSRQTRWPSIDTVSK